MAAHKNDRCLVDSCRHKAEEHSKGAKKGCTQCKCKNFEFVAFSTRPDSDILATASFPSESSNRTYTVTKWAQGDWSCNCTGFRNFRYCKHCDEAKDGKGTTGKQIHAAQASGAKQFISSTKKNLDAKMQNLEAYLRGDPKAKPVSIEEVKNEADFYSEMFGIAKEDLDTLVSSIDARAKAALRGDEPVKKKTAEPEKKKSTEKVTIAKDPFDPFAE